MKTIEELAQEYTEDVFDSFRGETDTKPEDNKEFAKEDFIAGVMSGVDLVKNLVFEKLREIHAQSNERLAKLNEDAHKNHSHVKGGIYDTDWAYLIEITRHAWDARARQITCYSIEGVLTRIEFPTKK